MTPAPVHDDEEIIPEVVQFLAWLKKRGAKRQLIYCKKKWDDILEAPVEEIVKQFDNSCITI